MHLGNRGAGKGPHTRSRLRYLHAIQAINFVPNSTLSLENYLCKFLISSLSMVPGSVNSFHIWITCVVLLSSKSVIVGANTCALVRERTGRGLRGGKRRKNLTKSSCWGSLGFDGWWPCPVLRHLIQKVVQSCFAGIGGPLPTFT